MARNGLTQRRAACGASTAARGSALLAQESFDGLCLGECPGAVKDLLLWSIKPNHVIPAWRYREAVGRFLAAPADLDGNRAILALFRREVVDRVGVLLVLLEVSLRGIDAEVP